MLRLSPDSSEFTVNTNSQDDQTDPSVAALAAGGFVITWTSNESDLDSNGIAAQLYDSDGNPVGDEIVVNTEVENSQAHPSIAALEDGGFVITWYSFDVDVDGSNSGISSQLYDADGAAVGDEVIVNSQTEGNQYAPDVAGLTGGGFVITWQSGDSDVDGDGYGISAQLYSADGTAVGSEFTANSEVENSQYHPSVAALENGGFVITWYSYDTDIDEDGAGISAQVFDADGTAVGTEISVATENETGQYFPTTTGLEGGGFVITWYSEDGDVDGDDTGISGQLYSADGTAVGSEFTVNSESEGGQHNPAVAALEGGGFVITWSSDDTDVDGDRAGIAGQLFDANGAPAGDEFTINTEADFNQLYPAVDSLPGGGFVVTWASEDPDVDGDDYGISARIYSADITLGSDGDDAFFGDELDNIVTGAAGDDALFGAAGDDSIKGGDGSDTLGGGSGDDTLEAGSGNDVGYAAAGDDLLAGQTGDDILYGGSGDDRVFGGTGNDFIAGGTGNDTLTGGSDADQFVFAANHGDDIITDFDTTEDTLILANTVTDFTSSAEVQAAASDTDEGLLIDLGGGNSVLLTGLGLDDISDIDFIF